MGIVMNNVDYVRDNSFGIGIRKQVKSDSGDV